MLVAEVDSGPQGFDRDFEGFDGKPMDPDEYTLEGKKKKKFGEKAKNKKTNKRKNSRCTGFYIGRFASRR